MGVYILFSLCFIDSMFDLIGDIDKSEVKYKPLFFVALFFLLAVTYYEMVQYNKKGTEIVFNTTELASEIYVDISGAVITPGVYQLFSDSRVVDLVAKADGISNRANAQWVTKHLNLSAKLVDAQKIYVPFEWEELSEFRETSALVFEDTNPEDGLINVNTATLSELMALSGVGEVYAQRIIDSRPYTNTQEVISKANLPKNLAEKIDDAIAF